MSDRKIKRGGMNMRSIKHFFLAMVAVAGLLLGGCGDDNNAVVILPSHGIGVVAFNNGWIGILNAANQTVSTPFLVGELGSVGGGQFDVVITPDRKTALVSNFGDSIVNIIDIRNLTAPVLRATVPVGFFAEDIALTPNGQFALVTDGGFSPVIAVIDVANGTLVETYTDTTAPTPNAFEAVAVAADGRTVLTVDYFAARMNTLTIDAVGHLTYVGGFDISNGGTLYPVNVTIAPDGKTALVASVAQVTAPLVRADFMRYPVVEITAPGVVALRSFVVPVQRIEACQSIVFNSTSTKAYALSNQEDPDPLDLIPANNAVVELDVAGPGAVSDTGIFTPVDFIGSSQLFGVDTIALDRTNRFLYVSNMTISGGLNELQVVDVKTASVVKTLTFADVMVPPVGGVLEPAIPAGIFIQ
jgi:DNA-binding beta-propeller fold protein YncE